MKKILFFAVAIITIFAFSSCKQSCTCTEDYSGATQDINLDGTTYNCDEYADLLNETADDMGYNQDWDCK